MYMLVLLLPDNLSRDNKANINVGYKAQIILFWSKCEWQQGTKICFILHVYVEPQTQKT